MTFRTVASILLFKSFHITAVVEGFTRSWSAKFKQALTELEKKTEAPSRTVAHTGTVDVVEHPRKVRFDTDSFRVGIDTHATCTMSTMKDHFEDLVEVPQDRSMKVQGIEGGVNVRGRGTFVFCIEDDDGRMHRIKVPNSLYVPNLPFALLSPQHWAQQTTDGVSSLTEKQATVLKFRGFTKTVPLSPSTNTPSVRTASGTI